MNRLFICYLFCITLLAQACSHGQQPGVTVIVPSEAVMDERYDPGGEIPSRRYVVRMSDGRRDWEIEFPEVATGYELAIPLEARDPGVHVTSDLDVLTEADMELLRKRRREAPGMEREGIYRGGESWLDELASKREQDEDSSTDDWEPEDEKAPPLDESAPAPTRPSYLLGVNEIQRLYRTGNYEIAMVKLHELSRAYPSDVRLLSMKGSLWLRLGQPELAAEAWEEVLRIDPRNEAVIRALGTLNAPRGGSQE